MPEENKSITSSRSVENAQPHGGFARNKDENAKDLDIFKRDWQRSVEHWKRKHRVWDYAYLTYKSILTWNNVYGEDYLRAFGLQVFVPLTYQTVESIKAQLNRRRTEIVVKGKTLKSKKKEEYLQTLDNHEWHRSGAEVAKAEAQHDSLIFGIGFLSNLYHSEEKLRHFPVDDDHEKKPQDPNDGEENDELSPGRGNDLAEMDWEEKMVTDYDGMKLTRENPYHIFAAPEATKREDTGFVYRYVPMPVWRAREFVVAKGWMTEEKARETITGRRVEKFDAVREQIDALYEMEYHNWSRGDHEDMTVSARPKTDVDADTEMTAFIERFEEDYYEIRQVGDDRTIYKDWNVYPHKEIPVIPLFNDKIPGEYDGIGEPEKLRWQQIEENRIHNYTLGAALLSIVQRYAINTSYLEDPNDVNFSNPFQPIRLKRGLPGVQINQAIQAMPQPDVRNTPFELLKVIRNTAQQTTGATDFVVGASESDAGTATESNNLLAATNSRIAEKARQVDEEVIPAIIKQWHSNFPFFYDTEFEFRLTNSETFVAFIPDKRRDVNENKDRIDQARADLDVAEGASSTLEGVYKKAGYDMVIFIDDISSGLFDIEVSVTDIELDKERALNQTLRAAKVMAEINETAQQSGDQRRFDIFELGKEALKHFPQIRDPDRFVMDAEKQMLDPAAAQQEQVTAAGAARQGGRQGGARSIFKTPRAAAPGTEPRRGAGPEAEGPQGARGGGPELPSTSGLPRLAGAGR